jgi:hypothetical protein
MNLQPEPDSGAAGNGLPTPRHPATCRSVGPLPRLPARRRDYRRPFMCLMSCSSEVFRASSAASFFLRLPISFLTARNSVSNLDYASGMRFLATTVAQSERLT